MTETDNNVSTVTPEKVRRERRTKIVFLLITLAVVALIYKLQRTDTRLAGWSKDLNASMAQAARENRPLLVLFDSNPPSTTGRDLVATTIAKNEKFITDGKYICVAVSVDTELTDAVSKKYKLRSLPTTMVLGPDGAEKNRREGRIGEVPFRQGFLDCTQVQTPTN